MFWCVTCLASPGVVFALFLKAKLQYIRAQVLEGWYIKSFWRERPPRQRKSTQTIEKDLAGNSFSVPVPMAAYLALLFQPKTVPNWTVQENITNKDKNNIQHTIYIYIYSILRAQLCQFLEHPGKRTKINLHAATDRQKSKKYQNKRKQNCTKGKGFDGSCVWRLRGLFLLFFFES